jgi:hypothetical protein
MLFMLQVTVTAPTATKHGAISKALNAIKEEVKSASDIADMSSPTPGGENSDSDCFSGGVVGWGEGRGPGTCEIDVRDIRGGEFELRTK